MSKIWNLLLVRHHTKLITSKQRDSEIHPSNHEYITRYFPCTAQNEIINSSHVDEAWKTPDIFNSLNFELDCIWTHSLRVARCLHLRLEGKSQIARTPNMTRQTCPGQGNSTGGTNPGQHYSQGGLFTWIQAFSDWGWGVKALLACPEMQGGKSRAYSEDLVWHNNASSQGFKKKREKGKQSTNRAAASEALSSQPSWVT